MHLYYVIKLITINFTTYKYINYESSNKITNFPQH